MCLWHQGAKQGFFEAEKVGVLSSEEEHRGLHIGHGVVWYGMVGYSMVWYGMVCYGLVGFGRVWYGR